MVGPSSAGKPGTTTGIDDKNKVIRIAVHGGSEAAVRAGAESYWNGGPGRTPRTLRNGYTVQPVFFDAGANAATAQRRCDEQAASAFLIYGSAGTEQIQACAASPVLRRGSVPYLSTGGTETGLGSVPNYFAASPTFAQQAPLIVRAANDGGFFSGRWAVVLPDRAAYADAGQAMSAALQASKAAFDPDDDIYRVPPSPRDCSELGSRIRQGGYTTVYFLTDLPAFFAQCVGAIGNGPTYTGPGATLGYKNNANLACNAAAGRLKAVYLHPVTGLDKAAERTGGMTFGSDVEYQVYSAMQTLEHALNLVEGRLTREKLIDQLRTARLPDGIAPGAAYKGNPFGGRAAYALQARCGGSPESNTFQTLKRYDR